jgi:hypothetical protein
MSLWLSKEELIELTGYKRPADKNSPSVRWDLSFAADHLMDFRLSTAGNSRARPSGRGARCGAKNPIGM